MGRLDREETRHDHDRKVVLGVVPGECRAAGVRRAAGAACATHAELGPKEPTCHFPRKLS